MRRKLFCKLLLNLILIFCAASVFAQADWMTKNAALLGDKSLNQIAIPGAHDAGTFAITASTGRGISIGSADGFSSPDNKKVKRFLSFGGFFSEWAKTQDRTTAQMLDDGIRYFDLRVCVNEQGVLMTCHGLYGAPLAEILDDVKNFTDQHPREVVLLGFNHFWDRQFQIEQGRKQGEIEGLTDANWNGLLDLVKTKLAGKLVSEKKFSPQSKLNDLWKLKTNNQVIALFDSPDAPADEFVWKQKEANTWVEGWNAVQFKAGTLTVLENAKNGQYADKFYAVRSSVTPDDDGKLITQGILSNVYPRSNRELAEQTNPVALGWIKNEWAGKYPINLIWSDFYDRADLVKLAESLNGIKVDFQNTPIGNATNWTNWSSSKENQRVIP